MTNNIELAQEQLAVIEKLLQEVITKIENSCIESATKSALVADLEEMMAEIHHLVPYITGGKE